MSNAIQIDNLTFSYSSNTSEKAPLFQDFSLNISEGDFVAVLGHNGSGKSTLAKQLNAILLPVGGSVFVYGMNTKEENLLFEIRKTCGMVFQNPDNQIVANVVEEDVAFAPENLGVPSAEIMERVDRALALVGMKDYRTHAPHLLSGGQKQRVAIAGAIAMQPKCIVFDEPTAMLDPQGCKEVLTILKNLKQLGITVILITHHMMEAVSADRILVLKKGKLVLEGAPAFVFSQKEVLQDAGLNVPDTVALLYALNERGLCCDTSKFAVNDCADEIMRALSACEYIEQPEDQPILPLARNAADGEMDPVLEVRNLSHIYSVGTPFEHVALSNVNLKIYPGEFIGIIGQTGSGKSTLIQHLNALLQPTTGSVLLDGSDINETPASRKNSRFRVGLVFQYPEYQLFEETVYKDIAYGPMNMGLSGEELDLRIREAAAFVGLADDVLEKSPFDLSGGQKRRVAIAGVLAMRPSVLILDEPTAGLDPVGSAEILENLRHYRDTYHAAILMVSHNMREAASFADRVLVLKHGTICMDATPREVFSQAQALFEIGLDVPDITALMTELKRQGMVVPAGLFTPEEAADAILTVKRRGVSC